MRDLETFAGLLLMNSHRVQYLLYKNGPTHMREGEANEVRRIVHKRAPWLTVIPVPPQRCRIAG